MTKREPFIMLPHAVYDSPTFAALNPIHIAVLLLLIRKYNGRNNGALALGVREAARRCHCSQATTCRALARLQKDRLITAVYKGHLVPETGRPDIATRWKLNFVRDSRHVSAISKGESRFPNETAGCFPGETSLSASVRFSGETSLRASLVKQSIDNLTAVAEQKAGRASLREPPAVMSGNAAVVVGRRTARTGARPTCGKPKSNGIRQPGHSP
jgi:hypothetical protein